MRLAKKEDFKKYKYQDNLTFSANGLLGALLVRSNEELSDFDLYSISNDTRKEIALQFKELRKQKYIIYSSLDDTYYVYNEPQN